MKVGTMTTSDFTVTIKPIPSKTIGIRDPSITYKPRTSIRLIIFNPSHQVLLIHVSSDSYYKLPGGGLEVSETHHEAGVREALEETGCLVTIDSEPFAMTTEWRNESRGQVQCQTSYCYRAKLVKDTGRRELTEEETEDGFSHEWIGLQEARRMLEICRPESEFGKFVREREAWFLGIFEEMEGRTV
ncbi:NUDIX domain-containing protein [Leptodontidium sp. MPI-SDFR-AT-0119]|nr:NUDIX domain-containing protein [Leptodontidium sp. MPI-SDFR-AT-0119]